MIDRSHELSIARQAKALRVSRGAVYYKPRPVSVEDLKIMRRLDELHLDYPFAGSRMLRDLLRREGVFIGRFTNVLLDGQIAISMDGKGAWRDNIFVERLWRSVKYEEVYLRAYDRVAEARASIARYLTFYNERRPHSALDRRTPDEAYFGARIIAAAA